MAGNGGYGGILVLAVLIGCIPGAIAQRKGHSFVTWWIFGAALFIVALPMSLMLKPVGAAGTTMQVGATPSGSIPTRECPFCKSRIRADALVCPHCQRESEPWRLVRTVWVGRGTDGPFWWLQQHPERGSGSGKARRARTAAPSCRTTQMFVARATCVRVPGSILQS
jgi:hypothetical protein